MELCSWVGGGDPGAAEGPATPTRGIGAAPSSRSLGHGRVLARAPGGGEPERLDPGQIAAEEPVGERRRERVAPNTGAGQQDEREADRRRSAPGAHLPLHFRDHPGSSVWSIT